MQEYGKHYGVIYRIWSGREKGVYSSMVRDIKECQHVDFTWSLPHMRLLIEEYIKEGKIKEVG